MGPKKRFGRSASLVGCKGEQKLGQKHQNPLEQIPSDPAGPFMRPWQQNDAGKKNHQSDNNVKLCMSAELLQGVRVRVCVKPGGCCTVVLPGEEPQMVDSCDL